MAEDSFGGWANENYKSWFNRPRIGNDVARKHTTRMD